MTIFAFIADMILCRNTLYFHDLRKPILVMQKKTESLHNSQFNY